MFACIQFHKEKDATHICLFLWDRMVEVVMNMNSSSSQNQEIGLWNITFRLGTGPVCQRVYEWIFLPFTLGMVIFYVHMLKDKRQVSRTSAAITHCFLNLWCKSSSIKYCSSVIMLLGQLFIIDLRHLNSIFLNCLFLFQKWKDCVLADYTQAWHSVFIRKNGVLNYDSWLQCKWLQILERLWLYWNQSNIVHHLSQRRA